MIFIHQRDKLKPHGPLNGTSKEIITLKTLDLHGFKADDVEQAVDDFLVSQGNSGAKKARIMTGKGKGIVRKIAVHYLQMAHFPWTFEKSPSGQSNEGKRTKCSDCLIQGFFLKSDFFKD